MPRSTGRGEGAEPEDAAAIHERERALEPVELIRQSGAIIRLGRMMLAAGTASYRVKEAMQAAARALGITSHTAHVTLTEITATTRRGGIFRTEVTEVRQVSVNADRIGQLDRLRRELRPGETAAHLNNRLDAIEARGSLYPDWLNALVAGAACAAFAMLNHARPLEAAAVFVAAALGQASRRLLGRRGFNHVGQTLVAAVVAASAYLGVVGALEALWPGAALSSAGYISAVLFLVPGFAMVTGALDMVKLDFSAGVSRTAFAVMIFLSAAVGVWSVAYVAGLQPTPADPLVLTPGQRVALWALASLVGVAGFALMFNSPWRMALTAAGIGAVANVGRLAAVDAGMAVQAATVLACIAIGVLAAVVHPRVDAPFITIAVPATLIMIPGATVYRTLVSVDAGFTVDTLRSAAEAMFVVLAIVVGLAISRMFTDRDWAFERH